MIYEWPAVVCSVLTADMRITVRLLILVTSQPTAQITSHSDDPQREQHLYQAFGANFT